MSHRHGYSIAAAALAAVLSVQTAAAADLPQIKISETNKVPECVTPGRLMSYVKARNEKLDPKFEELATEYMRHGEEFGLRWDYAFFQMMLETNTLKYTGDVKISQNNFAGLGATGRGARGESFSSVSDGVRAHLQHILMYAGEKIENPVAERTKNIQEWGVLTKWQATIDGPMTYSHLAKKWAPTSRGYTKDVDVLAGLFFDGACKQDDPNPELVAEARKGRGVETNGEVAAAGKGAEIAKKAVAEARAEGGAKSGLGAESIAKATYEKTNGSVAAGPPVKVLNAPAEETAAPAQTGEASTTDGAKPDTAKADMAKAAAKKQDVKPAEKNAEAVKAPADSAPTKIETAALSLAGEKPKSPAGSASKCRVFTASYGGAKSVIIKALSDGFTNYTVLDVNEGAEKRETEAYIGAYAKGGETVGEALTQDRALEKAFELCPEG